MDFLTFARDVLVATIVALPGIATVYLSLRNGFKADSTEAKVEHGNRLTAAGNKLTAEGNSLTAEVKTLANGVNEVLRKELERALAELHLLKAQLAKKEGGES